MKLDNVMRIYRHSYFGNNYFYTILMDYSPWKICYSRELILNEKYMNPGSIGKIKKSELLKLHNAVSEIDSWIIEFFRTEDVLKWRKAVDVIPQQKMNLVDDGSTIGLIWKSGRTLKEISYQEGVYPGSIPFPEFRKLESLIDHLDGLSLKY